MCRFEHAHALVSNRMTACGQNFLFRNSSNFDTFFCVNYLGNFLFEKPKGLDISNGNEKMTFKNVTYTLFTLKVFT